jgi:hypothetical protein
MRTLNVLTKPRALLLLVLSLAAGSAAGQSTRVENVDFEYLPDDSLIVIQYDLSGEGIYAVDAFVALDDGPFVALAAVEGNVGAGVVPGRRNTITWDVYEDYPRGFTVDSIVFRVDAVQTDAPSSSRRFVLFAGAGAALVGAAAAVLLGTGGGGGGGDTTTLAAPPGRPPGN